MPKLHQNASTVSLYVQVTALLIQNLGLENTSYLLCTTIRDLRDWGHCWTHCSKCLKTGKNLPIALTPENHLVECNS